jgi:hypothetical protein
MDPSAIDITATLFGRTWTYRRDCKPVHGIAAVKYALAMLPLAMFIGLSIMVAMLVFLASMMLVATALPVDKALKATGRHGIIER